MVLNKKIIDLIKEDKNFDKKIKSYVLKVLEHEIDFTSTSGKYKQHFEKLLEENIDQEVMDL